MLGVTPKVHQKKPKMNGQLAVGAEILTLCFVVPCFPAGSDVLIGDVLVLLGASLYAVSNVCEEYIVKRLSRCEFLGMVGLFGTLISGVQL